MAAVEGERSSGQLRWHGLLARREVGLELGLGLGIGLGLGLGLGLVAVGLELGELEPRQIEIGLEIGRAPGLLATAPGWLATPPARRGGALAAPSAGRGRSC